jgi:beta-glucosidase
VIRALAIVLSVVVASSAAPQNPPPYRNPKLPIDERVNDLLSRMTLEEKFWQLYMSPGSLDDPAHDYSKGAFGLQISVRSREAGSRQEAGARQEAGSSDPARMAATIARAHAERVNAIQRFFVEKTRLGIPIIPFEEAVHGLAREGATMFPQAIALAATFDTELMKRVSGAIAAETGSRGIRQALSPVVNIADDVRWGRVEETYGEDPYLAAEMGRAFVEAFEAAGIITTPKHWVANVGEGGRDSYPIEHSERRLQERYFPPFEVSVREARARSVMTAYNSVDGQPATQNRRLLNEILKRDWAFRGFVISDAAATGGATVLHMTEPNTPTAAAHAWNSGLDVVFQSTYPQHRPYWDAVQRGLVDAAVIDAAVTRVLRAKFELGLFEKPYADPAQAAARAGHADHRALALDAARASMVLLRNEGHTLPFDPDVKAVAVIGPDAVEARLGGYSGPGIAPVSILDGLRQRLGAGVAVRHVAGPGREHREYVVVPADALKVSGEYFDNNRLEGAPRLTRADARIDFRWTLSSPGRGIPFDWYSVRWTGTLVAPAGGVAKLGVEGNDGYRLWVDDTLVIDNWRKQSYGAKLANVALKPGPHAIKLEFFESTGIARVKLIWDVGVSSDEASKRIDEAVALARASQVAVVVAGVEEGEFRDRAFLKLPGKQEELIQAVAATGKPVVVVLIGGSAITMSPWLDNVRAVVHAWYPGEQGGLAVADVLAGRHNPSGRLPITFPVTEGQLPLSYNHKPTGRGDDYVDLTGMALFPFGFGLSYTTFEYSNLQIVRMAAGSSDPAAPATMGISGKAVIRCRVKNTGTRAGHEVVQLYLRDVLGSVARPVMELKGMRRVFLEPGAEAEVSFEVGPEHLRFLDERMKWTVEPGVTRVMIGASSEDIRLRGELEVK